MSLPRAVLEAEQRAERLHQELLGNQSGDTPPNQETPPEQTEQTDNGSTPPPSDAPKPEDALEHRYKVLQGKYNSEVPRLASENKDLKGRLQNLEHELEVLKNSKPIEPLVRPEEIEEYGEGLIDVARRIAREELAAKQAEIDALKNRIDSLSNATTQKVEVDFFKSLTEAVPDWQAINEDPNFLSWLDEFDELTGEQRQALLSRAEKSRDPQRVAKFFTTWKKTSQSWAAGTNRSLESQITPATNRASTAPPSKKYWTRAEVSDFYARVRRGDIGDKEALAIEADIHAAQIEGRLR